MGPACSYCPVANIIWRITELGLLITGDVISRTLDASNENAR